MMRRALLTLLVLVCSGLSAGPARAQEAFLVTYGPGPQIWAWFGHNALWLRDPELGLDHTFSFGYFDIDRDGFYLDFARGHMPYFGAANLAEREFAHYRAQQRSIKVQRLNFSPAEVRDLHRKLESHIEPFPQYYAYDYFFANCSTWLRDLIDQTAAGLLSAQLKAQPAELDFAQHVQRLSGHQFWISTGKLLLLGAMIDRPRTRWEEGFLPDALAAALEEVVGEQGPLVLERFWIEDRSPYVAPDQLVQHTGSYLAFGALALLLAWSARGREVSAAPRLSRALWRAVVVLLGLAGAVILAAAVLTTHQATHGNAMVLVLHPLWWGLLWPKPAPWQRVLWWALLGAVLLGALALSLPIWPQQRVALLLWLLPWAAVALWLSPARPVTRRDAPFAVPR